MECLLHFVTGRKTLQIIIAIATVDKVIATIEANYEKHMDALQNARDDIKQTQHSVELIAFGKVQHA